MWAACNTTILIVARGNLQQSEACLLSISKFGCFVAKVRLRCGSVVEKASPASNCSAILCMAESDPRRSGEGRIWFFERRSHST
nr:hypothetical protein [Tanacetum cinerariifolium]